MTIVATVAVSVRTAEKLRNWLSVRHSLPTEAAAVLGLYGVYELARGLVVGDAREADHNAHRVVTLERWLHLFAEANVQHAARALPGLTSLLGTAYLTLHLAVTAGVLLWLHQRRPAAFPFVRTTLLLASGLSLVGFLVYPTAPPRLAGVGIVDTVSNGHVDLNHGLVSSLYNPYAAVPSMHLGYALIIAARLVLLRSPPARAGAWSALPAVRAARGRRHRQPLPLRRRHRRSGRRRRCHGGRPTDSTRCSEPDQGAPIPTGAAVHLRGACGMIIGANDNGVAAARAERRLSPPGRQIDSPRIISA
jgi:hypothetical protein